MNRIFWMAVIPLMMAIGSTAKAAPCCAASCCEPAGECGDCDCCESNRCELICETKIEKKHCFTVECKEVCTVKPGPMQLDFGPLCRAIGSVFALGHDNCGCRQPGCDACGEVECRAIEPRCGHPITVKKLVKQEIEVQKPAYRCHAVGCGPACCEAPTSCEGAVTPPSLLDNNMQPSP